MDGGSSRNHFPNQKQISHIMKTPVTPSENAICHTEAATGFPKKIFRMFRAPLVAVALLFAAGRPAAEAALPVPVDGNGYFHLQSPEGPYVGYAPDTYNENTPISLFVWMHGCGGQAAGDMFKIAPWGTRSNQSYIAISLGGKDGMCWNMTNDRAKVRAAIEHVSGIFNINPRKIYIGGYSSGGDLAYRFGFENAGMFAGILGQNTDPFRDTGSNGPALMAAASWKINVAHLLATGDQVYPASGVRANLQTLADNQFPVHKVEKPGGHYENSDYNAGTGTDYDTIHTLMPFLDMGWESPAPAGPEMQVTTVSGELADGGTLAFGSATAGTAKTIRLTIKNTGASTLGSISAVISGEGFSLGSTVPGSIAAGQQAALEVRFTPPSAGAKSGTLRIASNDADENPFDLTLTGTGGTLAAPEISISHGPTALADGISVVGFDGLRRGENRTISLTIRNSGNGTLLGIGAAVSGEDTADFTVTVPPAASLAPGASTALEVVFSPSEIGARAAVLRVSSNDANENPFDLQLVGKGIRAPEIAVRVGKKNRTSGAEIGFGTAKPNAAITKKFVIRNTGDKVLKKIKITSSGSKNFRIVQFPTGKLAPGARTVFTVRFAAGNAKLRKAKLLIASNDADENPFVLNVSGRGTRAAAVAAGEGKFPVTTRMFQSGSENSRHLVLTADPSTTAGEILVEVSSDRVSWNSGGNFTETLRDEPDLLKVRDRTAVEADIKRFIRARVLAE